METYTSKSLQTFNGHVTIYNPETGGHRTFEIKTGAVDSWAKGRRFISLKTGPNYGDNTAFAFIWMDGTVKLFKKFEFSSEYHAYLRMLQIPEQYMARGLEYKFETTCRKCNRPLTVPSSIDRGLGPVCAGEAADKPPPTCQPNEENHDNRNHTARSPHPLDTSPVHGRPVHGRLAAHEGQRRRAVHLRR